MSLLERPAEPRVLIVEDDPLVAELIEMALEPAGYQVTLACDGIAGLKRLRESAFDAVVLDLNMPRLDGHGVLRALREGGDLARLPVMVLTGRGPGEEVDEAMRLGARGYLSKPFDLNVLVMRVGQLVGQGG